MQQIQFDRIIIGAGLYGLYAALKCAKRDERVCVLEKCSQPFARASFANQARVHLGYHYPRSQSTARKCAGYFERFHDEFGFCINGSFKQIYATSSRLSWISSSDFFSFCKAANIPCEEVSPSRYFKRGVCDGAFLTNETTYDAAVLRNYFLEELMRLPSVNLFFSEQITSIDIQDGKYVIATNTGNYVSSFVLNATYASTNEILSLAGLVPFDIKFELCEVILAKPSSKLEDLGITVMDGPFFSVMPFGMTGFHSLTSVTFTPHETSYESLPVFLCMSKSNGQCTPNSLSNCVTCPCQPYTSWPYMNSMARKYLLDDYSLRYCKSLFTVKPILKSSEIDDSRPTVIRVEHRNPTLISVLSGKISTVFDLDDCLDDEDWGVV